MTREEAIEVYNGLINIKIKEAFEFFAPELKVSEDERVTEMLRIAVKQTVWLDEDKNRCYRWLDKQVEKKSKFKNLITQEERDTVFEQKPALDIEIPFGAKDSELQEASYHIPEGFHAEINGNRVVIKRGEQKPDNWIQELEDKLANATPKQLAEWKEKYFKEEPAEWSEEDEQLYNDLSDTYFYNDEEYPEETYKRMLKRVLDWMDKRAKLLRPKQEWSNEDERIKDNCISFLGFNKEYSPQAECIDECINWPKSLRPQSHWKPSERQIYLLNWVANILLNDNGIVEKETAKELQQLLEQLKKL